MPWTTWHRLMTPDFYSALISSEFLRIPRYLLNVRSVRKTSRAMPWTSTIRFSGTMI